MLRLPKFLLLFLTIQFCCWKIWAQNTTASLCRAVGDEVSCGAYGSSANSPQTFKCSRTAYVSNWYFEFLTRSGSIFIGKMNFTCSNGESNPEFNVVSGSTFSSAGSSAGPIRTITVYESINQYVSGIRTNRMNQTAGSIIGTGNTASSLGQNCPLIGATVYVKTPGNIENGLQLFFRCPDCPPGKQLLPDRITCDNCANGTFKDGTNNGTCIPCQNNTYQNFRGASSCANCPENADCVGIGLTDFACRAGFYRNGTLCSPCPAGSAKALKGNNATCQLCEIGFYRSTPGGLSCNVCPAYSSCLGFGNTIFKCNPGYTRSGSVCVPCPSGTFKQIEGNQACSDCAVGTYQPKIGSTNCITCPNNTTCGQKATFFKCNVGFTLDKNHTSCQPCSSGTFKDAIGNETCLNCPTGFYQNAEGKSNCIPCPRNSMCFDSNRFVCDAGFTISPSLDSCVQCESMSYKPYPGNFPCTPCPPNADCNAVSFGCKSMWKLNTNGTGCDMCGPECICPLGMRCSVGSCPGGYYKKFTALDFTCLMCPNNSTCLEASFKCKTGFQITDDGMGCKLMTNSDGVRSVILPAAIGICLAVLILFFIAYCLIRRKKLQRSDSVMKTYGTDYSADPQFSEIASEIVVTPDVVIDPYRKTSELDENFIEVIPRKPPGAVLRENQRQQPSNYEIPPKILESSSSLCSISLNPSSSMNALTPKARTRSRNRIEKAKDKISAGSPTG